MIAGCLSQCRVGKLAFSQRTSVELVTAPGPSKPYGTREDLTTGGPANCPMRRDPFPTHVKLTMRSRSEEHTSELQSLRHLVCRLLLEKKKKNHNYAERRYPCTDKRRLSVDVDSL